MYADDAALFIIANNEPELIQKGNIALEKLNTWTTLNKLTINTAKTKFMIFKLKTSTNASFPLFINSNPIEKVSSFKFLGLILQEDLKWLEHMNVLRASIRVHLSVVRKIRAN